MCLIYILRKDINDQNMIIHIYNVLKPEVVIRVVMIDSL